MVSKAARRYASAFLKLSLEKGILEKILEDIRLIDETIDASRELDLFLRSPVIRSDDKRKALAEIFSASVDPVTMHFLDFIARKGRERLLGQIMRSFLRLYKEHAGIIDVEVRSAMELEDEQREKLQKTLEETTGKKVEPSWLTDPGLIGGLAVRIDDTVIDGTVKHKIDQLGALFLEAAMD